MSKPMMHKGYSARIEYSDEDGCFIGRVSGIRDIITFHGESVQDIRQAFEEAVNFYLESCAERGETPNKPFTGRLMVRLSPELHSALQWQPSATIRALTPGSLKHAATVRRSVSKIRQSFFPGNPAV